MYPVCIARLPPRRGSTWPSSRNLQATYKSPTERTSIVIRSERTAMACASRRIGQLAAIATLLLRLKFPLATLKTFHQSPSVQQLQKGHHVFSILLGEI